MLVRQFHQVNAPSLRKGTRRANHDLQMIAEQRFSRDAFRQRKTEWPCQHKVNRSFKKEVQAQKT